MNHLPTGTLALSSGKQALRVSNTVHLLIIMARNVVQVFRGNLQNVIRLSSRNCQARTVDPATHLRKLGAPFKMVFRKIIPANIMAQVVCVHKL